MSLSVETGPKLGIIQPENADRPPEEVRFSVQPLSGDRFSVHHPFHGPFNVGDTSVFADRHVDKAAAILLRNLTYLIDSRKLNRPYRFETRPYASDFAELSHCVSLGLMGSEFGGGPMEVFDGLWNDASKVHDGHQGDDNYQGHGNETLADLIRGDFFQRAGIIKAFVDEGVLRPNGHGYQFGRTRLYLETLLEEDEATVRRTFMSNKHPARRMDNDKFQYNEEERFLTELWRHRHSKDPMRVPKALAAAAIDNVQRMIILDDGEGDQLVFTDVEVAERSSLAYVEQNALHWTEPVQDLVNDLLNLAERYFFVCDDNLARDFQYFYPRDYLHTSSTLMYSYYEEVATRDPFMKWLLDTAENIARDQRQKQAAIIDGLDTYHGPNPPDSVKLMKLPQDQIESSFRVADGRLLVDLPKGKNRTVDPRIILAHKVTKPLSEVRPSYVEAVHQYGRFRGNYRAEIELSRDSEAIVTSGIAKVEKSWGEALKRLRMPPSEFQHNIRVANEFVYAKGRMS